MSGAAPVEKVFVRIYPSVERPPVAIEIRVVSFGDAARTLEWLVRRGFTKTLEADKVTFHRKSALAGGKNTMKKLFKQGFGSEVVGPDDYLEYEVFGLRRPFEA